MNKQQIEYTERKIRELEDEKKKNEPSFGNTLARNFGFLTMFNQSIIMINNAQVIINDTIRGVNPSGMTIGKSLMLFAGFGISVAVFSASSVKYLKLTNKQDALDSQIDSLKYSLEMNELEDDKTKQHTYSKNK